MFRVARRVVPTPLWMAVLVVAVVAPLTAVPSNATAQSLDDIRGRIAETQAEQERIQERITENQVALEELLGRIAGLEEELADLEREVAGHERDMAELDALVSFRVREAFKYGASLDPISVLLSGEDPSSAIAKASTVQRLVSGDRIRGQDLAAARVRAQASSELLAERTASLRDAEAEFEAVAQELTDNLDDLRELEASLTEEERAEVARIERERREREERERREREAREAREAAEAQAGSGGGGSSPTAPATSSPAPTGGGGMACPLDQPRSFIDSWGYARSGGRSHRGTDIMGPHGIPVRAITDGVWQHQRVGRSAGVWGILRGSNGDHYWYMHLTTHTVSSGSRVSAGQQIGTNGSTGNASAGAPHVHFELHPGGGSAVNPYRQLRSVCG